MLVTPADDYGDVLRSVLALASFVCCGLVIASFAMFTVDQAGAASKHQVAEINSGSVNRTGARTAVDSNPGQPRKFIDQAAHTLTAPFRTIFHPDNQWAARGFATICALLVYGLGLGYLGRFTQGLASNRYRPSPHS